MNASASPSAGSVSSVLPRHYNILVADDETAVTTSVSFVLKKAGHTVGIVHDGRLALAAIAKDPGHYQILITDHVMGEMTGLDLVHELHKIAFGGKIVVLSANLTHEIEGAYREAGVERFIYKPFDLSELRDAINSL